MRAKFFAFSPCYPEFYALFSTSLRENVAFWHFILLSLTACVCVRIINPQWDKIYVVQYREASNKNFENTRDLCGCLWQKMERERESEKKRDNFHCYWKFNVPEVAAAAKELLEQHHSTHEIKKELAKMRTWCFSLLFNETTRRHRRRYLKHERNIYKLFPFISISIPFIMWQVSAFSFLWKAQLLFFFSFFLLLLLLPPLKSWEWIWMWN